MRMLVIDVLPYQVPRERGREFFRAEKYFLGRGAQSVRQRFFELILKLSCYYPMSVVCGDEDKGEAAPEVLEKIFTSEKYDASFGLFTEGTNILACSDDIYMTVFSPSESVEDVIRQLAAAHGLFVREVEDSETK